MCKNAICPLMKFSLHLFLLHDICFQWKTSLLQNNVACLPVWFRSFIHMEGTLHTYNHDLFLPKNTTYIPGFNFIVMLLYIILHACQSNGSLLCEGKFAHTRTNIFFKEYHKRLKWVLKGFQSETMLSSFHRFLYLFKRTLHSCTFGWK